MIPLTLICTVLSMPHDGDTLRCASGERVRLAAVDARELNGSCHNTCAPMTPVQSRDYLARKVQNRTISFRIVGKSGKRLVGENMTLRCDLLRAGAVVEWPRYIVRYGLKRC